jgi:hypothetical protein
MCELRKTTIAHMEIAAGPPNWHFHQRPQHDGQVVGRPPGITQTSDKTEGGTDDQHRQTQFSGQCFFVIFDSFNNVAKRDAKPATFRCYPCPSMIGVALAALTQFRRRVPRRVVVMRRAMGSFWVTQ